MPKEPPQFDFTGFAQQTIIAVEVANLRESNRRSIDTGRGDLFPLTSKEFIAAPCIFCSPFCIRIFNCNVALKPEKGARCQLVSISYILTAVELEGQVIESDSVPFSHKFDSAATIYTDAYGVLVINAQDRQTPIVRRRKVGDLFGGLGRTFSYCEFVN